MLGYCSARPASVVRALWGTIHQHADGRLVGSGFGIGIGDRDGGLVGSGIGMGDGDNVRTEAGAGAQGRQLTNAECNATSCYGYSCEYWNELGYTCTTMETNYGCNCMGCECGTSTPTSGPTWSEAPSVSVAPTFPNEYEVWTVDEIELALERAEGDARTFVITVISNVTFGSSMIVPAETAIKVVGSLQGSGDRVIISPTTTFSSNLWSCYYAGTNLRLENLEMRASRNSALYISSTNSSVTVVNCRFVANWVDYGGAAINLRSVGTVLRVFGSEFIDNHANYYGGAILVGGSGYVKQNLVILEDSKFARNWADEAGAVLYTWADNHVRMRNCTVHSNSAPFGGALSLGGGSSEQDLAYVTIVSSELRNNSALSSYGALYVGENTRVQLADSTFAENAAAAGDGGALYASRSVVRIHTCHFDRNEATGGAGGAIMAAVVSKVHVIDSNFTRNLATGGGGAVHATGDCWVYPRGITRFVMNSAEQGSGGAISLFQSYLTTDEGNLAFIGNRAQLGGALSATDGSSVRMYAGCQSTTFNMNWARLSSLWSSLWNVHHARVPPFPLGSCPIVCLFRTGRVGRRVAQCLVYCITRRDIG